MVCLLSSRSAADWTRRVCQGSRNTDPLEPNYEYDGRYIPANELLAHNAPQITGRQLAVLWSRTVADAGGARCIGVAISL